MFRVEKNTEKVSVFIESESIQKVSKSNNDLEHLLQYRNEENFQFIRSPLSVNKLKPLNSIDQFSILYENDDVEQIKRITIGDETIPVGTSYTQISFNYRLEEIKLFTKYIYQKTRITQNELGPVLMLHIYMTIFKFYVHSKDTRNIIFLTQDNLLLKNREKFEKKLGKLNIMTLKETMIYLDLFAKKRNLYYAGPHHTLNKGYWYWNSFRTKIKHYHVPTRKNPDLVHILEAFASRYTYLLMSVDEVGKQHYFPDDVDFMIPYHYNYFLWQVEFLTIWQ